MASEVRSTGVFCQISLISAIKIIIEDGNANVGAIMKALKDNIAVYRCLKDAFRCLWVKLDFQPDKPIDRAIGYVIK
jgi:hypothetical protein